MGLTILEASKLESGVTDKGIIIQKYAGSSDILLNLPFEDIPGNAIKYNRESSLPGVGFRGVNESYTPSTGVLNPLTESLVIAGGDLDVDKFIVDTMGANQRSVQELMKARALALAWTKGFIKGDSLSDAREFDGLQTRVVGDQKIAAGSTANGTPLSLAKLDEAIDQTLNATHIIASKAMIRKFSAAGRTASVSGYVTYGLDELGRRATLYNGLPLISVDLDHEGNAILPFTEAATSGTATATSMYIVSMGADGLTGLQNGSIDVRDMGELQDKPVYRSRVEWYNGIAIYNGRAATRLYSISDAAITA